ncbi:platelet glycoprotein Ib alpha chain-like, partial [Scomber scombrus]
MQLFIVLLLFVSHVAMVAAVTGCHSGRDKDHRPQENCTAAGYSDVTAEFELTTKVSQELSVFIKMQLFIVVLLFLSHVAMVAAVAGCHSGRDKDHRPQENCTAAGYSDVTAEFELTTK